jgi:hypothetical protein
MSVKKTGSPLSSGAESLDPLGGKEELRGGEKVSKNFEAALAEVAGQIEKTDGAAQTDGAAKTAFKEIAGNANLDTPEGALTAIRESAGFLVKSRLNEDLRDSEQGRKIADELSDYISKDPYMHRKLLGILQKLR